MPTSFELFDLPLMELTERLSRPDGGAGVGAACAAEGALGAALVSMALRSVHREPGRGAVYALARADELDRHRERFRELAAEDERAFRRWCDAEGVPPADEAARRRLREAREACVEVPLDLMETALSALRLAGPRREELPPAARCDLAVGAHALAAACAGAHELVRANLELLGDEAPPARLELAGSVRREALALAASLAGGAGSPPPG